MNRQEKLQKVEELAGKVQSSKAIIFTDYRGLNVEKINKLRNDLRKESVEYHVVKNTLMNRAFKGDKEELDQFLVGPTAVTFGGDDPALVAKIIKNFAAENKALEIKGAVLDSGVIDQERVKELATLPNREVLLAQVLAGFQAPVSGFVRTLSGILQQFVMTLEAVRQQKEA